MGHPQVRWSGWLMTQNGGIPAQVQGDEEGIGALPLIGWNVPLTRLSLPIYGGAHPTWDTRGSRTPPIAASPVRPASDMLRRDPPHGLATKPTVHVNGRAQRVVCYTPGQRSCRHEEECL